MFLWWYLVINYAARRRWGCGPAVGVNRLHFCLFINGLLNTAIFPAAFHPIHRKKQECHTHPHTHTNPPPHPHTQKASHMHCPKKALLTGRFAVLGIIIITVSLKITGSLGGGGTVFCSSSIEAATLRGWQSSVKPIIIATILKYTIEL